MSNADLDMSIEERDFMRKELLQYYPGDAWYDKVMRMSNRQLLAVAARLRKNPPVIKGRLNSLLLSDPAPTWKCRPHYYCDICGCDYIADNPSEHECRCCGSKIRSESCVSYRNSG